MHGSIRSCWYRPSQETKKKKAKEEGHQTMSLFQCAKCGCLENTALTRCSHGCYMMNLDFNEKRRGTYPALLSYKQILGLKPEEPFGKYCCTCCPVWYDAAGMYGVGPNPKPSNSKYDGGGLWHEAFERMYLPKGQFETAPNGNLRHKIALDEDVRKWALPREEGT